MRQRVVIIGLGDTGLLSAVRLVDDAEVIAISPTNGMVSGQDMGFRIARPKAWASTAVIPFSRYENLDKVRIIHGRAARVEADVRTVVVEHAESPFHWRDASPDNRGTVHVWHGGSLQAGSLTAEALVIDVGGDVHGMLWQRACRNASIRSRLRAHIRELICRPPL